MAMLYPDGISLILQDNVPCHSAQIVRERFEEPDGDSTLQPDGGCTLKHTGFKEFAANVLLQATTGHLQSSCRVLNFSRSELSQRHINDQQCIRQVVIIFWLIDVRAL